MTDTNITALVAQLRGRAARMDHMGDGLHYYGKMDAAFDREAADALEALQAENERLRDENEWMRDNGKPLLEEIERLRKAEDRLKILGAKP